MEPGARQPRRRLRSGQQARLRSSHNSQGNQASPQEQEIYNKFTSMALMHLYDPKSMKMITKAFKEADNPREEIGRIAASVGITVLRKAKEAGEDVPGDVILNGGQEIVSALVEIYEEVTGKTVSEEDANGAFYWAADQFREMAATGNLLDKQALSQDMDQINRMDQDGSLQKMLQALQQEQQGEGF